MEKIVLCQNCAKGLITQVQRKSYKFNISNRWFSASQTLEKRKQSKYQPLVRPLWEYGATHRYMRGLDVEGDRYGPLHDRPDYTFLDGRPTPLTPKQAQERLNRIDIARRVVDGINKVKKIKQFSHEKITEKEEARKNYQFPLKPKS